MAFSTQRVTSDGTLATLAISIEYFDRSEISVLFDGVLTTTGWSWVGSTDHTISFSPEVPEGVEVLLVRATDLSEVRHQFSLGAAFKASTVDEDFMQILHIAQEARENTSISDIYQDFNVHGFKVLNVGLATNPGDAVSLGQFSAHDTTIVGYKDDAAASATAAAASATAAHTSEQNAADAANAEITAALGTSIQPYDADTVKKDVKNTFTAQQIPMVGALTDAASIAWDGDVNGQVVALALTAAVGATRTMAAPTNIMQYATYCMRVQQDSVGNRALTFNSAFKFGTNGAPTLTTTANKVDWLSFIGGAGNTLEYTGARLDAV